MKPIYITKPNIELKHFICAINDGNQNEEKEVKFSNINIISSKAFQDVSGIKRISCDRNLTKICRESFKNCEDLEVFDCTMDCKEETPKSECSVENLSIPKIGGDFTIESLAFSKCKNLHTVILPECSTLIIEKDAFENCSSLRTVIFLADKIKFTENPFENCPESLVFVGKQNSELEKFTLANGYRYIDG